MSEERGFIAGEALLYSRLPHIAAEIAAQPDHEDNLSIYFSLIEDSCAVVAERYLDPQTMQQGAGEEAQISWTRDSPLIFHNSRSIAFF